MKQGLPRRQKNAFQIGVFPNKKQHACYRAEECAQESTQAITLAYSLRKSDLASVRGTAGPAERPIQRNSDGYVGGVWVSSFMAMAWMQDYVCNDMKARPVKKRGEVILCNSRRCCGWWAQRASRVSMATGVIALYCCFVHNYGSSKHVVLA